MWFEDVDVYPASVPNKQLASLVSCGARNVGITEIFYCDLSPILDVDSVKYQVSRVEYQQPDSERCEVDRLSWLSFSKILQTDTEKKGEELGQRINWTVSLNNGFTPLHH